MTRIREAPPAAADPKDDLWPSIRARIEQEKVLPLRDHVPARGARSPFLWAVAGVAAAAVIVTGVFVRRGQSPATSESTLPAGLTPAAIAESTSVYEEQARFLLNQLELRRALLRPQTAASVDHDLQVIDAAIAELKRAIERDPRNIALRALLASSYKQKVDLLKRVGSAG